MNHITINPPPTPPTKNTMSIKELGNQPYTVKQPNQQRTINPEHEKYRTHLQHPDYGEIVNDLCVELGFVRDPVLMNVFRHTKDGDLEIYCAEEDKKIYVSRLDKKAILQLEFFELVIDQDRTMLRVVDFVNEVLTTIRGMYKD